MSDKKLCDALVVSIKPAKYHQCTHPAKFKYQLTRFKVKYFCGVHARMFKNSPNLTPLTEEGVP